jgi:hypothetical protein
LSEYFSERMSSTQLPVYSDLSKVVDLKMQDLEFIGDISGLLRVAIEYDHHKAYDYIKAELLEKL